MVTSILTFISWRATHPCDDFHPSGVYSRHATVPETFTVQRRPGVWCVSVVLMDHRRTAEDTVSLSKPLDGALVGVVMSG